MVSHGVLKLRVKDNWGVARAVPKIAATDSDDESEPDYEFVPRSETEPSWASKLRKKMKALFCFQEKGQYKAHVDANKARIHDKMIMRKIGLDV
ncbi:Exocyst complex component 7 [Hordeum vulgare]|nr:Exocyst complex component 7 [Hordeum vulgare]